MKNVATLLRALQLYAHAAHNLAKGATFFEDHEYLGELYAEYESDYDAVVERIIGINGNCDISSITKDACSDSCCKPAANNAAAFAVLKATEASLCAAIDKEIKSASTGTQNLLQGIADRSEMRQYKLSRRLK